MVITSVKNGSPDMIPVAFEREFDELKDELPPDAHRPLKTLKQKQWVKVGSQKVEKKQWVKEGIYSYICI